MDKQQQISERNEYIKNLQGFIFSSKGVLYNTLDKLKWKEEATIFKENDTILTVCPLDSSHRVPDSNIKKHLEICQWHQQGYKDDSVQLPPPSTCSAASITIDKEEQAYVISEAFATNPLLKIGHNVWERDVPQTSDRVFSDFTTDERRVLYDYVVSRTAGAVPQLKEFSLTSQIQTDGSSQVKTKEQLLAAERDAKRRRVRYRVAKVHTKSRNYSEVMREVITNQMLAYEEWLREEHGAATGPSSPSHLEEKKTEEPAVKEKEMVWLDWDYNSNPHIRWKYVLEREKRRLRQERDGKNESKEKGYHNKEKNRESGSSRKREYNDNSPNNHSDSYRRNKYRRDEDRHRYNKSHNSDRQRSSYDYKRSDRQKCHSSGRHSYYRNDSYTDFREKDRHRSRDRHDYRDRSSDRHEYRDRSRDRHEHRDRSSDRHEYRDTDSKKEDRECTYKEREKDYEYCTTTSKYEKYQIKEETCVNIKKEYDDKFAHKDTSDYDLESKRYLLHKDIIIKKEITLEDVDSDGKSSQSSSSSHNKKHKKRNKSKKKHRHKHKNKKKRGSKKIHKKSVQSSSSSTDVSDE